jgi:hypothetical protein
MSEIHDKVHAFADGELPEAEAEAFRAHLVECAQCEAELREIMMLAAVTQPLAGARAPAVSSAEPAADELAARRRRRRRALIATVTGLAAAAAIVILWRVTRPEPIVLAQADRRPLEARLSFGAAERWRPYDVERTAGTAREEVRVDTLAQLERRGEWRGLGDGYLLAGEPARAAEALARAGESAEAESDRAALALQTHDAAAALAHATRALRLSPGYGPATWNRALALRDLGLVRAATGAFAAIAARGEKGWCDEAKARTAALRTAVARDDTRSATAPAAATAAYDEARARLQKSDAKGATQQALEALRLARTAEADPRDLPRRAYVLLADAARAQGETALADAYVDEARLLIR